MGFNALQASTQEVWNAELSFYSPISPKECLSTLFVVMKHILSLKWNIEEHKSMLKLAFEP